MALMVTKSVCCRCGTARNAGPNFGRRYCYSCTECKKILGISHRKGFWMG